MIFSNLILGWHYQSQSNITLNFLNGTLSLFFLNIQEVVLASRSGTLRNVNTGCTESFKPYNSKSTS